MLKRIDLQLGFRTDPNYVVDKVKEEQKEDVSILTHPLMVICLITLYLYNACLVVCILANLVSLHLKLLWVGVKGGTITLFGELVIIEVLVIVVILTFVLFW